MHKILKSAKVIFLSLVALFLIALGAVLALRFHRQHVTTQAIAIRTPNGIDEGMYVRSAGSTSGFRSGGRTARIERPET